jgi:uncharacterized membrane protein
MKKFFLLAVVSLFLSTNALASSCEVPKFLKVGVKIKILGMVITEARTVVEIDEDACWFKDDKGRWYNLTVIEALQITE